MNCKQGDLALVIGPAARACIGKVVTCVEFLPIGTAMDCPLGEAISQEPAWLTDRILVATSHDYGLYNRTIRDRALMPLRPPASDETDIADQDLPAECGA